jgi:Glycosyl transferase family 11
MTVIKIIPYGRLGNQMMQLMFATAVQRLATTPVSIEGYDLPEWGLSKPASPAAGKSAVALAFSGTRANSVAGLIDRYRPAQIDVSYIILRASNLLPPADYLDLFPLPRQEGTTVAQDELLIHIRLGDVGSPTNHIDMGPLPFSYYSYLIATTKLRPVFIGQVDGSLYCEGLRREFPQARFLSGGSVREDFQTLRRARHIALSVGTYSWVAAYLSHAQSVHVPLCGIYDFSLQPEYDLLPTWDPRFVYHRIPKHVWCRRYTDFLSKGAAFEEAKPLTIWLRRNIANARMSIIRSRVRYGVERRLLAEFLRNRGAVRAAKIVGRSA